MKVQIKPHSCISPSTITRILKEFLATATKMCFEIYLSTNKSASKVIGHLLELPITERNARAISTGYIPKLSRLKVGTMIEKKSGMDRIKCWTNSGNFAKTNVCKSLFWKMKTLHWNLAPFSFKWQTCVVLWSVWKRLQPVWPKYHVVSNITSVVFQPTLMFNIS